jgi:hypothetical protein
MRPVFEKNTNLMYTNYRSQFNSLGGFVMGNHIFVREHGLLTCLCWCKLNTKPKEGDIIRDYDNEKLLEIKNGQEKVIKAKYPRPIKVVRLRDRNRGLSS